MKTIDILIAAKVLISKPNGFAHFYPALTKEGNPVCSTDKSACKFCTIGAINKIAVGNLVSLTFAISAMRKVMGSIGKFNDLHTQEEVLQKFDEAIANESTKEKNEICWY